MSTTAPTTTTTTTSTTTSSTSTTTTTLRSSTVKDLENIPTEPVTTNVRRMDGSKIIFSDQELEARNRPGEQSLPQCDSYQTNQYRNCPQNIRGSSQQDIFP